MEQNQEIIFVSERDSTPEKSDWTVEHDDGYYYGPSIPDPPRKHMVNVEITTDNSFTLEKKFFCDKPTEKLVKMKVTLPNS